VALLALIIQTAVFGPHRAGFRVVAPLSLRVVMAESVHRTVPAWLVRRAPHLLRSRVQAVVVLRLGMRGAWLLREAPGQAVKLGPELRVPLQRLRRARHRALKHQALRADGDEGGREASVNW
jgi:hypothetical protein